MKETHMVAKPHECKNVIVYYPVIAFQVKLLTERNVSLCKMLNMFYWATHELVPKLLQLPLHSLK